MIRAAILGGTGYGGMELLRYLVGHPDVEVTALTSRTEDGPVADRYPHLRGFTDLSFTKETDGSRADIARGCDVLFFAKPHGVSANELKGVLADAPDVRVVDLSGDFRLVDDQQYPEWYGYEHPSPDLLGAVVYGLPEGGHRDAIREARAVANPGCHAVATILALHPLAVAGQIKGRVGVVSITGSSGSGSKPKAGTHHPERFSNFKAYRPLHHQHVPEVIQVLGGDVEIDFVPHSAPIARGIHVTAFVPVKDAPAAEAAFRDAYGGEPMVRVLDAPPEVRAVVGTGFADVHVAPGDGVAVVMLAIDNLGKGMAANAIQNMNLMFGLDETAGLDRPGAGL